MRTTVGQLLVNEALPEEYRDYSRVIDKKTMRDLLTQLADKHPDKFKDTNFKLHEAGAYAAHVAGGGFDLSDLELPPKTAAAAAELRGQVRAIVEDRMLSPKQREEKIKDLVGQRSHELEDMLYEEAKAAGNPFALQVASGSRGSKADLRSILLGDMLVSDHKNRIIPVPIMSGYAEGVTPEAYWAGAYGTRKGQIGTKLSVADAGFYGKLLQQAAHRLVVTERDCGTTRGITVSGDDRDNVGAVLANDVDDMQAGSVVDTSMLRKLGGKEIVVRSPVTCQASKGICARCAGVREKGKFPDIGDAVGVTAAQTVSERISQMALGCLAGGTMVRMADWSTRAIETLKPGDMVIGVTRHGETFATPVLRVFNSGIRACVHVVFREARRHNSTLVETLTPDHKVLACTYASMCKEETFNHVARILPVATKRASFSAVSPTSTRAEWGTIHDDRALLLGLLLGDGCYTPAVERVYLSCADPLLVEDTRDYLARHGLVLRFHKGSQCYWRVAMLKDMIRQDSKTGRVLAGSRNPAKCMLEEFGCYGKYAHEKQLPAVVWQWDNASVAALLGGLWATDGSIYPGPTARGIRQPFLCYASTSLTMVQQVRDLLAWRFCIYGAIKESPQHGRKHRLYALNIAALEDVRRFLSAIPLVGVKRNRAAIWLKEAKTHGVRNITMRRNKRIAMHDAGFVSTYDIEIGTEDHLFLLASGLVVSNSKHAGGRVAKGHRESSVQGLALFKQLIDVPTSFKEGAAVASMDGTVRAVSELPQGGFSILVGDKSHFVPPGFAPKVRPGDVVEAGDILSDGLPNPAEIVAHKGIGEGRRAFVNIYSNALRENNVPANRRNVELLARGLINHVRVTDMDGSGSNLPDDIVEYADMERGYEPRYGFSVRPTKDATGMYLEKPALHYTIGTRVTKSVADTLGRHGVKDLTVHADPPGFEPEMVRAMEQLTKTPDWQTRLGGSFLEKGLLEAAHRGRGSDPHGTSYVPALVQGKDFGKDLTTKGTF